MRSGIVTGIIAVGLIFAVGCGASAPEDRSTETIETEPAAPEPEPEPEPQPETGGWRVSRSTNPLDDSTTVVAVLNAAEGVGGIIPEPISLIARCQSNTTEVYIVSAAQTVRFDCVTQSNSQLRQVRAAGRDGEAAGRRSCWPCER